MKKIIVLFLSMFIVISMEVNSYASVIDIENQDKVTLKYELKDGTIKVATQTNKHNGQFAKAVENLLDYYYNIFNVSRLISINDVPMEDTQYTKYAGRIDDNKKGLGYSSSPDIAKRTKENKSMNLSLIETDPKATTIKLSGNDGIIRCTGNAYIDGNITYIPFVSVMEALGFDVISDFNDYYKLITATKRIGKDEIRVEVKYGSKMAYKSNVGLINLDSLIVLKDGIVFINLNDINKFAGAHISIKNNVIDITPDKQEDNL